MCDATRFFGSASTAKLQFLQPSERLWMNCHAVCPEREPRCMDHSSACLRSSILALNFHEADGSRAGWPLPVDQGVHPLTSEDLPVPRAPQSSALLTGRPRAKARVRDQRLALRLQPLQQVEIYAGDAMDRLEAAFLRHPEIAFRHVLHAGRSRRRRQPFEAFTAMFRKHFGLPPSAFYKQARCFDRRWPGPSSLPGR